MTGQFGKNHLGDLDEFLPTNHGFDVWKNPYTPLAWPSLVNLRADPFERAMDESLGWGDWSAHRSLCLLRPTEERNR